jgi:hypothetical protein
MGHVTRCIILWAVAMGAVTVAAKPEVTGPLKVASNGRYLVHEDGTPFFWLGDTAWQLIHDLTRQEVEFYITNRAGKGFTVIQTVILAEYRPFEPNRQGHGALEDGDPTRPIMRNGPDNDYWDDVEFVLKTARDNGLYVGLLPTWGNHVTSNWQNGLVDGIFNANNAESYGRFVGRRFRDFQNIIWIIGGDRAAPTDESRAIWRALARGVTLGIAGKEDYDKTLMTYHTSGPGASWWFFNGEPWMDIRAAQSGHGQHAYNWRLMQIGYSMKPTKPMMDLETAYPGFRHGRPPTIATDDHARRGAYWSVFAGSCGHTYGHHSIWQMADPLRPPIADPPAYWYKVLDVPSAFQMGYLRRLMESRPFVMARPAQNLIATEQTRPDDNIEALRGDGFIMVYTPTGKAFTLNVTGQDSKKWRAWWFDPRKGESAALGTRSGAHLSFDPPGEEGFGNDWVLVLDEAGADFGPPGEMKDRSD